ncbi:MAG TPA: hypothetical protein VMU64_15125 [Acidimicrobiales bacterium]|nr:hypothetical protein [Acidimicrobiales bacterium]
MTQPNFVPIVETDQVRPSYRLRPPAHWRAGRVSDLRGPEQRRGREFGVPGPDQGYALLLAHTQFEDRLELSGGITAEDALVGCAAVGSRRAALFGRAPVAKDIELALVLFGFLGDGPEELVTWRAPFFQAAAHHYNQQRAIAGAVAEDTLRMAPTDVRGRLSEWRSMMSVPAPAS